MAEEAETDMRMHLILYLSFIHREQNLVDRLLERLEIYSKKLETKVEMKIAEYEVERQRGDELLYQMLPKLVANDLKRGVVSLILHITQT